MTGQLSPLGSVDIAEQTDSRATVARLADELSMAATRANTRDAFEQDWKTWEVFCTASRGHVDPLEVSGSALVLFAAWLASDREIAPGVVRRAAAPATVNRRVTGVLAGWRQRNLAPPRGIGKEARRIVDRYARELVEQNLSTGRGKAPALTIKHLRAIIDACPNSLAGVRDAAVVLIGFAIAARRSEIAHLDVTDFVIDESGLLVHVRFSKTKVRRPAVLRGQNPATCPIRAWEHWLAASGVAAGPAFRAIDRHGNLGGRLSGPSVGNIITRAGNRAGLEIRLTGHSVRSGLATEARRAGHDAATIAAQGGWMPNSSALHEYIRIVDQWTDNALAGIGL